MARILRVTLWALTAELGYTTLGPHEVSGNQNFNLTKIMSKYFLILCNLFFKHFIDEIIGLQAIDPRAVGINY